MEIALRESFEKHPEYFVGWLDESEIKEAAEEMARLLALRIGGSYWPNEYKRQSRDAQAMALFNGKNKAEVMERFGMSKSNFYRVLEKHRKKKKN